MARNELDAVTQQHVVQLPNYVKEVRYNTHAAVYKITETIKLISRDQGLSYTKEELEREFPDLKKFKVQMAAQLLKSGLRFRMVEDQGKILLFANTIKSR